MREPHTIVRSKLSFVFTVSMYVYMSVWCSWGEGCCTLCSI